MLQVFNSTINVVLIAEGDKVIRAVSAHFEGHGDELKIRQIEDPEEALITLVSDTNNVCLIRSRSEQLERTIDVLAEAHEAGIQAPMIVMMDLADKEQEQALIAAGAMAAFPWDGTQSSVLRNVLRLAARMRRIEEGLRINNSRLSNDLIEARFLRESAEEQNAEMVRLAEDLAVAKSELESLNDQKNRFFSIIAHDLRSPFTALLGYTTMLSQGADKMPIEKVADAAESINTSAKRLHTLLENLLEWARVEMGGLKTNPQVLDLQEIATRCVDLYSSATEDKGLVVETDIQAQTVYADEYCVETVVRNLLANAIKFSPPGSKISIQSTNRDEDEVLVRVTDEGAGMDADRVSTLFDISKNSSTPGTSGEKGTGLGLVLCKELAERNGGSISVQSAPGQGTRILLTLPAKAPA